MRLADWQRGLLAAALDRSADIAPAVATTGGRDPERGLAIVCGGVQALQRRALGELFPVLGRLLGDDSFAALADRYLAGHVHNESALWQIGAGLPAFLDGFSPLADWPYLADVARLEWGWQQVFHAADDPPCDWSALSALSAEAQSRCRLRLPTASALMASVYPVVSIWKANQPGAGEIRLDLDALGGERALILRTTAGWPQVLALEEPDYVPLDAIRRGATLAELTRNNEQAARLPALVERGWLGGYTQPAPVTAQD